jgi:hypothetical protein
LCFIRRINRPSKPKLAFQLRFQPVEVDSEVTIAETSADTPLVAGAAFNFPLVFTQHQQ